MTIEHKNITEVNLHEPKGVSLAGNNRVYVANGAGSGAWGTLPPGGLSGVSGSGVSGQSLVGDGAGNLSWQWPIALGSISFTDFAAPYFFSYPASYTKLAPVTIAGGNPTEFSEGTNARLTYTGVRPRRMVIECLANATCSVGATRDIKIAVYKNGILLPRSETMNSIESTSKRVLYCAVDTSCVTNDYFEAFVQNTGGSGNLDVYTMRMHARGSFTP